MLTLRNAPVVTLPAMSATTFVLQQAPRYKAAMDQASARRLMFGFAGTTATPEALELARYAGGAILFARNVESPAQVAALSRSLKEAAGARPFLVAVDQEGGRVARLRPPHWSAVPTARALGAAGPGAARRAGQLVGRELRACGFDLDFARVLDVDTNPANPVIADRSFGATPAAATAAALAFAEGLHAEGVASCGKHFPGHGDTAQDSHKALPRLPHSRERLEAIELPPFAAAARAGLPSLMTAHVVFDALDPGVPATMSRAALTGLLRGELGYRGVVVSDDLEMKGIADHFPFDDAVLASARAGVDLFLVCHTEALQRRLVDVLAAARLDGRLDAVEAEGAERRLAELAARWAQPAESIDPANATRVCGRGNAEAIAAGADPTEWRT